MALLERTPNKKRTGKTSAFFRFKFYFYRLALVAWSKRIASFKLLSLIHI